MAIDLELFNSNDYDIPVYIVDENDATVDIRGWTIYFTVKEALSVDVADSEAKINHSWVVSSGEAALSGETMLSLTKTQLAIAPKKYVCDLQGLTNEGKVRTIDKGTITIAQRVKVDV